MNIASATSSCRRAVGVLALTGVLYAQSPPAAPAPPAQADAQPVASLPVERGLKLVVLAGNGEVNDIQKRLPGLIVVEVRDTDDRIVEGADVVFRFPPSGPSAYFPGPKLTQTKRTNAQGQASPDAWVPNSQAGNVLVKASATYANLMGETEITMVNAAAVTQKMRDKYGREMGAHGAGGRFWSNKWVRLGIIGAAAGGAAAAYFLLRDNKSSSTVARPTVTISPGGVSIGGPP
ncbi:MAG: hypothetical protein IT163_16320 [Bryobacterales bacterium]|nr:hypothetical protein [Bryobacterales bacterium]